MIFLLPCFTGADQGKGKKKLIRLLLKERLEKALDGGRYITLDAQVGHAVRPRCTGFIILAIEKAEGAELF